MEHNIMPSDEQVRQVTERFGIPALEVINELVPRRAFVFEFMYNAGKFTKFLEKDDTEIVKQAKDKFPATREFLTHGFINMSGVNMRNQYLDLTGRLLTQFFAIDWKSDITAAEKKVIDLVADDCPPGNMPIMRAVWNDLFACLKKDIKKHPSY